jgi:hypothetical protein
MTRRPETQEQATKQINALTVQIEAIEAEAMKLVGIFTPEATTQFRELQEQSEVLIHQRHDLVLIRIDLPTQAQWDYEADMRLQEQIANDPYGGDDFMAFNMMGDCW